MGNTTYKRQSLAELTASDARLIGPDLRSVLSRRGVIGGMAGAAALAVTAPSHICADATPGTEPTLKCLDSARRRRAPRGSGFGRVPSAVGAAVTVDFYERVYERPAVADLFSISLVRLSKEFEIEPTAALSGPAMKTAPSGPTSSAKT
jgi:hypothetical protein